jgi:hypothetical protein
MGQGAMYRWELADGLEMSACSWKKVTLIKLRANKSETDFNFQLCLNENGLKTTLRCHGEFYGSEVVNL